MVFTVPGRLSTDFLDLAVYHSTPITPPKAGELSDNTTSKSDNPISEKKCYECTSVVPSTVSIKFAYAITPLDYMGDDVMECFNWIKITINYVKLC